jgi:hypothetical protein
MAKLGRKKLKNLHAYNMPGTSLQRSTKSLMAFARRHGKNTSKALQLTLER